METIKEMLARRIRIAESDLKMAHENKKIKMLEQEARLDMEISYCEGKIKALEMIVDLDWVELANITLNRISQ